MRLFHVFMFLYFILCKRRTRLHFYGDIIFVESRSSTKQILVMDLGWYNISLLRLVKRTTLSSYNYQKQNTRNTRRSHVNELFGGQMCNHIKIILESSRIKENSRLLITFLHSNWHYCIIYLSVSFCCLFYLQYGHRHDNHFIYKHWTNQSRFDSTRLDR